MSDEKTAEPITAVLPGLGPETTYAWDSAAASSGFTIADDGDGTNNKATLSTAAGIKAVRLNSAFDMSSDNVQIRVSVDTENITGARLIVAAGDLETESAYGSNAARWELDTGKLYGMSNDALNHCDDNRLSYAAATTPNEEIEITFTAAESDGTAQVIFSVLGVSYATIDIPIATYPTLYLYFARETGTDPVEVILLSPFTHSQDSRAVINTEAIYAGTAHLDAVQCGTMESFKRNSYTFDAGAARVTPAHSGAIMISTNTQTVSLPEDFSGTDFPGAQFTFISASGSTLTINGVSYSITGSGGSDLTLASPAADAYGSVTIVILNSNWYVTAMEGTWVY
jgi:virulence-associated protein VagC